MNGPNDERGNDDRLRVIPTDGPPSGPSRKTGDFEPALTLMGEHDLCPGCGEPVALRQILDAIDSMNLGQKTIGVIGIGCYTALTSLMDIDLIQALHGRAPSVATGAKRSAPTASCSRSRATVTWSTRGCRRSSTRRPAASR